jgi:hypothetical protein
MHSVSMQMFKILTELIFRDLDRKIQIEPATRARICKRLWSPGIDSTSLCSLANMDRIVVPARHDGEIDSWAP